MIVSTGGAGYDRRVNPPPLLTHRIGDEWVAETPCSEIRNPAFPDEVVALVSQGATGHLSAAASAARAALPAWSAMPAPARGEILFRASALLAERAERIGRDLSREEGKTISEPLAETKVFPAMVVQMINVGEQTGALDQMLSKIADFYEDEVDTAVSGLMKLIEPLLITVLGAVIGTIVTAMYLPLYSILSKIG